MFWDKRKLEVMEVELGHFLVTCIFKNTEDGFQWAFTGVLWASGEEQIRIVIGRIGVDERVVGEAMVHRWRFQYGPIPQ